MDKKDRILKEAIIMQKLEYTDFIKLCDDKIIIHVFNSLNKKVYPSPPFKGKLIDRENMVELVSGIRGIFDVIGEDCNRGYIIQQQEKRCVVEKYMVEEIK